MTVEQAVNPASISSDFNAPDADLILLSPDPSTEFHVHKVILAEASPFFRDMFTLPQVDMQSPSSLKKSGKPIVPVTESSNVLGTLLQFVYPCPDPSITSLDELPPLLDAAIKYDFTAAILTLRRLLTLPEYLQTRPMRVYAIACRFDLEDEARISSSYTLRLNLLEGPLCDDLKYISAWQYHRLLSLHRTRSKRAQEIIDYTNCPTEIKCAQCNSSFISAHGQPKWWYEWEKGAKKELSVRPVSDVIFGMEFLAKAAKKAGCIRCTGNIVDCWKWLMGLKEKIDALPATV